MPTPARRPVAPHTSFLLALLLSVAATAGASAGVAAGVDARDEPDETYSASLSSPGNAAVADGVGVDTIVGDTIVVDDAPPLAGRLRLASATAPVGEGGGAITVKRSENGYIASDGFEYGDFSRWSARYPGVVQALACPPGGETAGHTGDSLGGCATGATVVPIGAELAAKRFGALSWAGWVQLGQLGRRPETLLALTTGEGALALAVDTGGAGHDRPRLLVARRHGIVASDPLGPGLSNFQWYHVAFVYDGAAGTFDYYLDGALEERVAGLPRRIAATRLTVGAGPAGTLDGVVEGARWADHALTPEEVRRLAAER